MSSCKSPGNNGLTEEFYVCFFKDVGQYLIDALNLFSDYGMAFYFSVPGGDYPS